MSRRFVVDTNVVVAGLLTSEGEAPTTRLLDAMLAGRVSYLLSLDLLAEYRVVLLRRCIADRHGLTVEEIDELLAQLAVNAVVVESTLSGAGELPRGDAHLGALLTAAPRALLVTGDEALRRALGPRALAPAAAWALVGADRPQR